MTRRLAAIAAPVICLVAAAGARAGTDNSCVNRDLERMDYYTNPPQGGDNSFFTTVVAGSGNVSLLYPATYSLRGFVFGNYEVRTSLGGVTPTGCTNSLYNGLATIPSVNGTTSNVIGLTYFMTNQVAPPTGALGLQGVYSPATSYPDPLATYTSSGGTTGFVNTSAYQYLGWPAPNDTKITSTTPAYLTAQTPANACLNALGPGGTVDQQAACVSCLTTNGYWLNPAVAPGDQTYSAGVFMGNFLHFYPPKWVLLKLAYKRLVNGPLLSSLREAVVAQNGAVGGQTVQMMLPQDCSGVGRPLDQKLKAIDGLSYYSTANPLAEMLWNTVWYMGGQQNPWSYFGNTKAYVNDAMKNGKSGPCPNCNSDFIVLFSDGRGDSANPNCTPVGGVVPPQCSQAAQCSTLGMGAEYDGDDFLDPGMVNGTGNTPTYAFTGSTRVTPPGTCNMDFADDVATWAQKYPSAPATASSNLTIFTVGIGSLFNGSQTILQDIAMNSKGTYFAAEDYATLEANIETVLKSIIGTGTSFSVAAITTVQTRGSTYAFIPRFKPLQGPDWNGSLYRFKLFNEFSAGCTSIDYGTKDLLNPNGNSSCTDIYLRDLNNNFIGEDDGGTFALLDTSQPYDGGWPILYTTTTYPDGGSSTIDTKATPVWEAAQVLADRVYTLNGGTPDAGVSDGGPRQIFTVAPVNTGNGAYNPALVPFTTANTVTITPLLQLGGYQGAFCSELAAVTRHTYATDTDCGSDVINFTLGQDVMLQNPLNQTTPLPTILHERPNILGDIFHSSPILETPPAPTFLCDIGIATQCLFSLYSSKLTPGGPTAYATYQTNNQYRPEQLLVGANDGMLHAFSAGTDTVGVNPDGPLDGGSGHYFNYGSGQEVWAFIPPDMLPKLQRVLLNTRHDMLVDGTPMVRDIWVDGSGASAIKDGVKQSDEFHTVVVMAEREGGRHYFALDVTNTASVPVFLWSWPPPGSAEEAEAGETWNDSAPLPPPIGPVAIADTSGPLSVNGIKSDERYIVAMGGGYDTNGSRGRGIFALDAWTGQEVLRFSRYDATGSSDPRWNLWPVAATPALLDTAGSGLFDTLVVGDVGGQMWTVGLQAPGVNGGTGPMNNWFGGRGYTQFSGQALYHDSPIFEMAAAAVLPGNAVRVYVGSGDRDQIKQTGGGVCALDNLRACIRKDCGVNVTVNEQRMGAAPAGAVNGNYLNGVWAYSSGGTTLGTNSFSANAPPETQSQQCTDVDDVQIGYSINCGGTTTSFNNNLYCDWSATTSNVECPTDTGRPVSADVIYASAVTQENARFYSYLLYDQAKRAPFTTQAAAQTYDTNTLTETNLVNANTTTAAASGNGWWVQYPNLDEKTSSGSLLLAGCVLWNTLQPTTAPATCTAQIAKDTAYSYQADAITGAIACGTPGSSTSTATVRSTSTLTIVPLPTFDPVVSVNASGQVLYGGVSITPGAPPLQVSVGASDVLGTIHWLEIPRQTHNCRHGGFGCQQ